MSFPQWVQGQANPEVPVNEAFGLLEFMSVYGRDPDTTTGLTWGYLGGRWGGFVVTAGTLTLTGSFNYVVVNRATGVISRSTTDTNWNDNDNYARVYKLTTGATTVTAIEDHRAGTNGIFPSGGFESSAVDINGGTIDGTTIGASVPSTGAFTTLTSTGTTTLNGTTIPASATLVKTTDKLSVLASTTSAELAGVISDETGTGALVFSASPALTGTPTAPTAAAGTNTTQLATTAHVFAERSNTATLTNKTITGGTTNPTTLQENSIPAVVQTDIGTAPNEIPLNQYLGEMAYMNADQVVIHPVATADPNGIGDMVFQLTNNTTLVIKVKGSDGVIRSNTLTLA
jgi:hypothetical protein